MGAQPRNEQPSDLPLRQAVLDQLEKVLLSSAFQGAERSSTLLRFLVEQTVAGHADRLKEYTLATQALGRNVAFDPRSDPIVRAEASRLRDRLHRYYAKEGRTDALVFDLPKGSYVPRFERRTAFPASLGEGERPATRRRLAWLALPFAAAAWIIAVILLGLTGTMRPSGEVSIAVLPLASLSSDQSREFFADGVTDEIAAALARVPTLKVVARSSAYAFKNQPKSAREKGQALGATHVIEGSVRQDEGRVRIAVQLTKTDTGLQLWSQVYDRGLTDIFALQEDIARNVAAALNVTLGLKPGQNLVDNRNIDPESYELFLRGKALRDARGGMVNLIDSARMFEQVTARNPNYAPAWATLGSAYYRIASNRANSAGPLADIRPGVDELMQKVESAYTRARALDPNRSRALEAGLLWAYGRLAEAEALVLKVLADESDDSIVLQAYGDRLAVAGRLKDALPVVLKAYALEPLLPAQANSAVEILWLNGRNDEAIALAKTLRPSDRADKLATIHASMGRFDEAADALSELDPVSANPTIQDTVRRLRMPPEQSASPLHLAQYPRAIDFLYLRAGMSAPVEARVLENLERRAELHVLGGTGEFIWHPAYAQYGGASGSSPSWPNRDMSITGVRKAGPNSVTPRPAKISSATKADDCTSVRPPSAATDRGHPSTLEKSATW
jgi:TolB-like protein/tetratricopeptide (TPR) repeat protein